MSRLDSINESNASATDPAPIDLPSPIPFVESLGVQLLSMQGGVALSRFVARSEHLNSWGVVHGGVVMAILDFTMAMAGRSAAVERLRAEAEKAGTVFVDDAGGGNITIEMKTSFLLPARGELRIKGICLQSGRSLSFCEGEVVDPDGRLVARASGTFKFQPARKG